MDHGDRVARKSARMAVVPSTIVLIGNGIDVGHSSIGMVRSSRWSDGVASIFSGSVLKADRGNWRTQILCRDLRSHPASHLLLRQLSDVLLILSEEEEKKRGEEKEIKPSQ